MTFKAKRFCVIECNHRTRPDRRAVTPECVTANQPSNGTPSRNNPRLYMGGIYSQQSLVIQNSTIAFNTATLGQFEGIVFSPGLAVHASASDITVNLQSTLISNNTYGTTENDFSMVSDIGYQANVTGSDNLIRASFGSLPDHTFEGVCPLLGPLRNNGRVTQSHALLSFSPAIDAGNDAAGLAEDQRGVTADVDPLPYLRVDNFTADIGAYEVQQEDILFSTSFEVCPALIE